nr:hypothetical protein [Armatimonadota bacterium]
MDTETDTQMQAVTAWYGTAQASAHPALRGSDGPTTLDLSRAAPGLVPGILLAGRYRLEQPLGAGA